MLTNFFGKSSPVNFIIVSLYFIIGYIIWENSLKKESFDLQYFSDKGMMIALCVLMILLLDFIIRKNRLTDTNSYSILIFGSFLLMVPDLFSEKNMLLSNFFLLLALRRILSVQSGKNLFKKILDASIWISVATLFYFWSILCFIPLLFSIILISNINYRHFLIPISGVGTVFVLVSTYYAFSDNNFFWFSNIDTTFSFNFLPYKDIHLLLLVIIIFVIVVWLTIRWLIYYPQTPKKNKPNFMILLVVLFSYLGIVILSEEKSGAEFFFLFAPISILFANYIEKINTKWIKEFILWAVVIVPIVILFL